MQRLAWLMAVIVATVASAQPPSDKQLQEFIASIPTPTKSETVLAEKREKAEADCDKRCGWDKEKKACWFACVGDEIETGELIQKCDARCRSDTPCDDNCMTQQGYGVSEDDYCREGCRALKKKTSDLKLWGDCMRWCLDGDMNHPPERICAELCDLIPDTKPKEQEQCFGSCECRRAVACREWVKQQHAAEADPSR